MNKHYLFVASQVRELEDLLAATPEEDILDRMSLEARLKTVKEELEEMSPYEEAPKARLTFGGPPVLDGHGIRADFGVDATKAFIDAFSTVAAGLNKNLSSSGPIPQVDENKLLITGTAIGSFGFEFEVPAPAQLTFSEFEKTGKVMNKIEDFFRVSVEGSDSEVAEIIEEIHPRAGKKIRDFLEILVGQHAWCGLEFGDRYFRYTDYEQIRKACARIKEDEDEVDESMQSFHGEFQGVLPAGRRFEFKLTGQNRVIRGKLDTSILDPDIINREWLHRPVKITLKITKTGRAREQFTLLSLNDLSPYEEQSQ